jgi:chromosome partitioning protein
MRRIAMINQKGGVGKTTTTVNVGAALARAGHRVLMIDLDPQAHMTLHLGINPAEDRPGSYQLLTGTADIDAARVQIATNLWIVGATIDLAAAEVELVSIVGREVILRDMLDEHAAQAADPSGRPYDYVIMDCPPSLGVLTLNGLCAAREVIIPLQPHYLALQGLSKLLETVSLVSRRINPDLQVTGVAICMKEAGTRLGAEVIEDVRSFMESARSMPVPWRAARVFDTAIRRNIKLAEAPSYGQSIFDYAGDSNGAKDYEALAAEIHDPAGFASRGASAAEPGAAAESPVEPAAQTAADPLAAGEPPPAAPTETTDPAPPLPEPVAAMPEPVVPEAASAPVVPEAAPAPVIAEAVVVPEAPVPEASFAVPGSELPAIARELSPVPPPSIPIMPLPITVLPGALVHQPAPLPGSPAERLAAAG